MQQRGLRNLRLLVAGVGTRFRQRALAPRVLYLLLAAMVLITTWLGRSYWPQLAPLVLLLLQSPWSGLASAGVERVAVVAMGLGLAQLMVHTARVLWFARALQSQVDGLDDAAILALLPPEVAEDARQWLGGDDRKAAELSEVVSLSVLYAALQAPGTRRRHLRRILMG